jgi:hypothetical protein
MLNEEDVILIVLAVAALPNKKKTLKQKRRKREKFPYATFFNYLLEYSARKGFVNLNKFSNKLSKPSPQIIHFFFSPGLFTRAQPHTPRLVEACPLSAKKTSSSGERMTGREKRRNPEAALHTHTKVCLAAAETRGFTFLNPLRVWAP